MLISLAVEHKELDGLFLSLSSTYTYEPNWLKRGSGMHPLLQFARKTRHPLLSDVPTAEELAKTDRAREMIEFAELPYHLVAPLRRAAGSAADRAKALQSAFLDMQKDPHYLAEAAKLQIDVSPIDGAEALELVKRLSQAPPELLNTMRKLHLDQF